MTNSGNQPAFNSGFPNPALDAVDLPLDLNKLVVKHPASTFYMRVEGSFGNEMGIYSNDILVIDKSAEIKSNDIIVVTDEGEFKLSTVAKAKKHKTLQVWGVVTYIIHKVSK